MTIVPVTGAGAAQVEILHADSLGGPMRALKAAYEAKHPGVTLNLASGVSRQLAQRIVDAAPAVAGSVVGVPDTVNAVRQGKADAGVVYYSAAVAARADVDVLRFPDSVNLSEAIRNAATVPGTARNAEDANGFVAFLISPEAQDILRAAGQPPVVPPIRRGTVPAQVR